MADLKRWANTSRMRSICFMLIAALGAVTRADEARVISDLDLKLLPIPAGTFLMGSAKAESAISGERPQTRMALTKPFWLARTETTQAQWTAIMGDNPSSTPGDGLPVHNVTWQRAIEFCQKLTERERAANRLPDGYVYLLPTEAQWEYSCRAGTNGAFAGEPLKLGWVRENSLAAVHPVATKEPNGWGLYDMHGNVWEWCLDWYGPYPGGEATDYVVDAEKVGHVLRGGSWSDPVGSSRSAFRFSARPLFGDKLSGFRVALVPKNYMPNKASPK